MNPERLYPVWFVLCALLGTIVGSLTGYGAIRGLTDGMLIAVSPVLLLLLAYPLLMLWRPTLPACRCGRCNYKGYQCVGPADDLQAGEPVRFKCPHCGRIYELCRDRFSELADDGRALSYMHHTRWGRWKVARAEQAAAGDVVERAAPGA